VFAGVLDVLLADERGSSTLTAEYCAEEAACEFVDVLEVLLEVLADDELELTPSVAWEEEETFVVREEPLVPSWQSHVAVLYIPEVVQRAPRLKVFTPHLPVRLLQRLRQAVVALCRNVVTLKHAADDPTEESEETEETEETEEAEDTEEGELVRDEELSCVVDAGIMTVIGG
jgi:hypothetical protein